MKEPAGGPKETDGRCTFERSFFKEAGASKRFFAMTVEKKRQKTINR